MTRHPLTQARLVALCILGVLLLDYPLLSLASRVHLVWGIPAFFLYAFAVWAGLVILVAWVVELGDRPSDGRPADLLPPPHDPEP